MQEYLQTYSEKDNPKKYQDIHQTLFVYYDDLATVEDIKTITLEQEEALVEANYHKQIIDTESYVNWFYKKVDPFNRVARYELQISLFEQLIQLSQRTVGEEHPEYAIHLNNLAALLESMGRYEEAEPLYRQAIAICEKSLGEDHPNTRQIRQNFANMNAQ